MSLKFAIIGSAHNHVFSFIDTALSRPDIELCGIADSDANKLAVLQEKYKCPVFNDWRELLDKIKPSAVGIAEINGSRGPIAIECARRGINVLSDKPLATRLSEVEALEQISMSNPSWICSVAFTLRFSEEGCTIKKVLDEGLIGEPVSFYGCRIYKIGEGRPDWMFNREAYGGSITDIGSHDIDLIRWLFSTEIYETTGHGGNFRLNSKTDFADSCKVFLRCCNRVTAMLDVNWLAPDAQCSHSRISIVTGTKGILRHNDSDFFLTTDTAACGRLDNCLPQGSVVNQFFDVCIGKNIDHSVKTEESIKSTKTALMIQQSVDKNVTLKIK